MDPFDVLGLKQGQCNEDDVIKAFRKLALRNHPDKAGPEGVEKMKSLNAARDRILNEDLCSKPPPDERHPHNTRTHNENSSTRRPDEPRSRDERFREHYSSEPSPHDKRSYGETPKERGPCNQRYQGTRPHEESPFGENSYDKHPREPRAHDENTYEQNSYKQRYQDERSPYDRSYEPWPGEQGPRDEDVYERQSYKKRYSERPPHDERPHERRPHEERSHERTAYEQRYTERPLNQRHSEECRSHRQHAYEEHVFEEYCYEEISYTQRSQPQRPRHTPHPDARPQQPRQRPPESASNVIEVDFWDNMPDLMRDVRVFLSKTRPVCTNTGRTPRTKIRELHDDIQSHLLHPFKSGEKERICSLMGSLLFAVKQLELLNAKTDQDARRVEADYTLKYTMSELDWVTYERDGSFLMETWLFACMPDIERQWRKEEMRWQVEGVWKM